MDKEIKKAERLITAFYKALKSFTSAFPVIIGVVLLLGLFKTFITPKMITSIFIGEPFRDTLIGSTLGSILTGNPITSYIIGGELLNDGVSLFAVTAFIMSWVTVGLTQLPAEALFLGKRFAVARNILSFILAIMVSVATVLTLEVIT
ncbi:MAG TPA: hypothetical protein ENI42_04535 [Thermoplasmatales archaeon]|nr:hypothetical protein [Thermoplasmatales archaeon]